MKPTRRLSVSLVTERKGSKRKDRYALPVLPCGLGIRIQPTFALVQTLAELIKGFEMSYASGSLNAGSSCIQCGL